MVYRIDLKDMALVQFESMPFLRVVISFDDRICVL